MRFEFDLIKSEANKRKHGIDFLEAQALWKDDRLIEVPARTTNEPRFLVIGRIGDMVGRNHVSGRHSSPDISAPFPARRDRDL